MPRLFIKNIELKRLKNETEYDQKRTHLTDQLLKKKDEFRQLQKELLETQKSTQDNHKYLVNTLSQNATLK